MTIGGANRFCDDDMIHAVRVWRSVGHSFVDLETHGGFGIPLDIDETFRRLMQATLSGLHAVGTPAPNTPE